MKILHLLLRAWKKVSTKRRIQLILLLSAMSAASVAEVVSLGAVVPFLGVLVSPERLFASEAVQPLVRLLHLSTPSDLLMPVTASFIVAAVGCSGLRMLVLWACTRLAYGTGADISFEIYRRTLYQPYTVHLARNSGDIITGIAKKSGDAIHILENLLNGVAAWILLVGILGALFYIDALVTAVAFGSIGLMYAVIMAATRKRLVTNSRCISEESNRVVQCLQEGLGGIREVLLNGCQQVYCDAYRKADLPVRRAESSNQVLGQMPRFIMEAFSMVLLATMAFYLVQQPDGMMRALPVLGSLAMGAQRLMPVLQQLYIAWVMIAGRYHVLKDVLDLLDQPLPPDAIQPAKEPISFTDRITLRNVGFRYAENLPWVVQGINLEIFKGDRIGFVGETGSGKTTLLDIISGLLTPTQGSIEIDGRLITEENRRSWQVHIAYVPQRIFLTDTTIAENIAFGVPRQHIDMERVKSSARKARISDDIERMPKKYQTRIGERGIRLSGGQSQRIAIARALYQHADVLVFDEATSALDSVTERAVMEAINGLGPELTVLIIAHRVSTLKGCRKIVEIKQGGLYFQKDLPAPTINYPAG